MDSMSDTTLQLDYARFLLPRDIFEKLFPEIAQRENQNQFGEIIVNDENEVNSQTIVSAHQQSIEVKGGEKNVQVLPIQQRYTWAQIVKGEHRNDGTLSRAGKSLPPLPSTAKHHKP
ncbi:hypothetical protein Fmac_024040 [Flemingia macrophylla]|uniref:Uncharacterized protein n=1 Tax=Flemingia macrophylla TaxID=520843 RepID=A0ABD1LN94_9FABA